MNKLFPTLGAALVLLAATGCQTPNSDPAVPAPGPLKPRSLTIWPVGDSITAGASACWGVWSPENGGYRRNLMLQLNDGYVYQFIGGTTDDPPGDDLPAAHSGYRGQGLSVFQESEFTGMWIGKMKPDAVLLLLGINSLGSKKEYPDTQGSYYSANGHHFNQFFVKYQAFIDLVLASSPTSVVFAAQLPPIGDTRFYQKALWDDTKAPGYDDGAGLSGWTTVGDGSVNPKDIVPEFNAELKALVDTVYAGNPRVVLVDQYTGMTVGSDWNGDVVDAGVPQNWWNGDALHPTQAGYRHLADRWNAAIRTALPTTEKLLYADDVGAKEGTASLASEGAAVGSQQSRVWDQDFGPDPVTGKKWGRVGAANYSGLTPAPTDAAAWFAWETDTSVSGSVATSTAGHELVYRFEVPAGGQYRVSLGFHDTWGENASPKATNRTARVFVDGADRGLHAYRLGDYGRSVYDTTNTTGLLEVRVKGVSGDALLDSITVLRLR